MCFVRHAFSQTKSCRFKYNKNVYIKLFWLRKIWPIHYWFQLKKLFVLIVQYNYKCNKLKLLEVLLKVFWYRTTSILRSNIIPAFNVQPNQFFRGIITLKRIVITFGFLECRILKLQNKVEKKQKISLILLCSPHVSDDIVIHILRMYHLKGTRKQISSKLTANGRCSIFGIVRLIT